MDNIFFDETQLGVGFQLEFFDKSRMIKIKKGENREVKIIIGPDYDLTYTNKACGLNKILETIKEAYKIEDRNSESIKWKIKKSNDKISTSIVEFDIRTEKWNDTYKWILLDKLLSKPDSDIIALSGIRHYYDFFYPILNRLGYESSFIINIERGEANYNEGNAIFWRNSRYSIQSNKYILLQDKYILLVILRDNILLKDVIVIILDSFLGKIEKDKELENEIIKIISEEQNKCNNPITIMAGNF